MVKLLISLWFFSYAHSGVPYQPHSQIAYQSIPYETQAECESARRAILPQAPACVEKAVWITYDPQKQP